ncbi:unnamed protein product [Urochloa humidicola]
MLSSASSALPKSQLEEEVVAMGLGSGVSVAPAEEQGNQDTESKPAVSEQQQETYEQDPMGASSSKAEQGEEGTKVTAAASQQQQEAEERDHMPPAASEKKKKEVAVATINEILSLLEPLPSKISELLESGGPRRARDHPERRALEFMKMELMDIAESLKSMLPPLQDDSFSLDLTMKWLDGLKEFTKDAHSLIKQVSDSGLRTLLRKPAQFFRRSNKVLLYITEESFRAAEYASKYRCLLVTRASSSDHVPPPCTGLPLFGIDRPIKKLLRWLTPQEETEKGLRFIAIVGAAGMGKTTLAMELHSRLQCQASEGYNSFQYSVVAHVSKSTRRMEHLLRDILSRISGCTQPELSSTADQSPSKTMELLVHHVREYLQGKRYFILIDDLWHRKDWEEIKGAFPNNNLDSRLLITTRLESIAWSCSDSGDVLVHKMKPLNQLDSERLLLIKAFGSVDGCPSDTMKLFCDKILMTCQGIPLFITGVADWLKGQLQQHHDEE